MCSESHLVTGIKCVDDLRVELKLLNKQKQKLFMVTGLEEREEERCGVSD